MDFINKIHTLVSGGSSQSSSLIDLITLTFKNGGHFKYFHNYMSWTAHLLFFKQITSHSFDIFSLFLSTCGNKMAATKKPVVYF